MVDPLMELWRRLVRLRFRDRCAVCRRAGQDCHHIFERNTRGGKWKYHPMNGVLLCRYDHDLYGDDREGLIPFLPAEQQQWYADNKDDKRFEYVDAEQIELELKTEIEKLVSPLLRSRPYPHGRGGF